MFGITVSAKLTICCGLLFGCCDVPFYLLFIVDCHPHNRVNVCCTEYVLSCFVSQQAQPSRISHVTVSAPKATGLGESMEPSEKWGRKDVWA